MTVYTGAVHHAGLSRSDTVADPTNAQQKRINNNRYSISRTVSCFSEHWLSWHIERFLKLYFVGLLKLSAGLSMDCAFSPDAATATAVSFNTAFIVKSIGWELLLQHRRFVNPQSERTYEIPRDCRWYVDSNINQVTVMEVGACALTARQTE